MGAQLLPVRFPLPEKELPGHHRHCCRKFGGICNVHPRFRQAQVVLTHTSLRVFRLLKYGGHEFPDTL
jgi:hypothetical protein